MDKIKLLEQLSELPQYLNDLVGQNGGISLMSGCNADTSDCSNDNPSCTSNVAPCGTDACPNDSCSDCSDTPEPVDEWYAVQISTEGVASMQIAYYDANGTRVPSGTGYTTYNFSNGTVQTFYVKAGKNCYIYNITRFEDGYGLPWTYAIQGDTVSGTTPGGDGTTRTINLNIYPESYCTVQIIATNIAAKRPNDWTWWSTISSGAAIGITASEWNAFTTRINEFREYANLSSYSFTTVSSGTPISYWIVNQARTAISEISGHGSLPSAAVSGGKIYASFFNSLASALNSVP